MNGRYVILITGSRKGIGYHLALHYLAKGFMVVGCSRQESSLSHKNYQHFRLDVTDETEAKKLFGTIRKQYGGLDALVNNAGIACMNPALLTPVETVRRIFETNFLGTFLFCREAAKLMRNQEAGRIVNFASGAVPLKLAGEAIYASSKAAVVSFTQILARELASYNTTVNAIGPGPLRTDLLSGIPEQTIQDVVGRQAIRRMADFPDVTNVVDFFLKPESSFITGQVIYLGGI